MSFKTNYLLILFASLLITACDGGIDGTGNSQDNNGGASVGAVTAFGSVWVNGVEFDTGNAEIFIEGQNIGSGDTAVITNLSIGHVVAVRGSFNADGVSGVATSVSYSDILEGPVASGGGTAELLVMGYTIIITDQTVLNSGLTLGTLNNGDVIEVSGFPDELGRIRATYIEKKTVAEFEVKGQVNTVGAGTFTLSDNSLTINYADAQTLIAGQQVTVYGRTFDNPVTFNADSIEVISSTLTINDGSRVEIEGYIANTDNLATLNQFSIGSQVVQISAQTTYEGGVLADLTPGLKVEAEGNWSNGILLAEEIEFEESIEIEAVVNSASVNTLDFVDLGGITVQVDPLTTELDGFTLLSELVGDLVVIRGRLSGTDIIATRVQLEEEIPTNPNVSLQGPVDTAVDPDITILGIAIDTSDWSESSFKGENDLEIGRTLFFLAAEPDSLVKASGSLTGTAITWDSLDLEN